MLVKCKNVYRLKRVVGLVNTESLMSWNQLDTHNPDNNRNKYVLRFPDFPISRYHSHAIPEMSRVQVLAGK
jgi:hypothetical protein